MNYFLINYIINCHHVQITINNNIANNCSNSIYPQPPSLYIISNTFSLSKGNAERRIDANQQQLSDGNLKRKQSRFRILGQFSFRTTVFVLVIVVMFRIAVSSHWGNYGEKSPLGWDLLEI